MQKPVKIEFNLPHPALPSANWGDCYELQVVAAALEAEEAAHLVLARFPWWARGLLGVRDRVVGLFGLKAASRQTAGGGRMIGVFPVVSSSAQQVVLGVDDRHLDFRIVVEVVPGVESGMRLRVSTLVYRKILLGRLYIALITPFHNLIVRSVLGRVAERLAPVT